MERGKGDAITRFLTVNTDISICTFEKIISGYFIRQQVEVLGNLILFAEQLKTLFIRQPHFTEPYELVKAAEKIVAMGGYLKLHTMAEHSDD